MKKMSTLTLYTSFLSLLLYISCSKDVQSEDSTNEQSTSETTTNEEVVNTEEIEEVNGDNHEASGDYTYDTSGITEINLNETAITVNGDGATATNSIATITASGTYKITGSLQDGQIIVNSEGDGIVKLIFNGININCTYNAPIYINQSEKTIILLEENTQNYISDTENYPSEEDANAALFSKDNLSISGEGTLTVDANFNDGITSKDGLIINSGTINVTAVDDGIRGKDYTIINNGDITIEADGDGIKSDNDSETNHGFITIHNGTFNLTTEGDAFQAETNLIIDYGNFNLITGGGNNSNIASDWSAKGIKASANIAITDGVFVIDSADDAIHANNSILITEGTYHITAGDDGIHSDAVLEINGGSINIAKSYEGIESADITINDGIINLFSSDDGLNVAGGADGSGFGGNGGFSSGNYHLYINGGFIVVTSNGDGIDVNGSFNMTGGTALVNGPTESMNGPLDYDGTFKISGGFLLAVGSSRMAQAPSTSSSQYSILSTLNSNQSANQMINIQDSEGASLFSFIPSKKYQSIAFSSPELKKDASYSLYFGGSSTGTNNSGLFLDGTYTAGTKHTNFTITSIVTKMN